MLPTFFLPFHKVSNLQLNKALIATNLLLIYMIVKPNSSTFFFFLFGSFSDLPPFLCFFYFWELHGALLLVFPDEFILVKY